MEKYEKKVNVVVLRKPKMLWKKNKKKKTEKIREWVSTMERVLRTTAIQTCIL